jgi:hypothetical protein
MSMLGPSVECDPVFEVGKYVPVLIVVKTTMEYQCVCGSSLKIPTVYSYSKNEDDKT